MLAGFEPVESDTKRCDAYVPPAGPHRWDRDGDLFKELMEAAWHPSRAAGLLACDA